MRSNGSIDTHVACTNTKIAVCKSKVLYAN